MENIAAVKGQKRGKNLKEKIFPKTPQAGPGDVFGPVWLTDEPKEARSLLASGECVAFVLTQENRGQDLSGISWCFAPEEGVPWEQDPVRAIGQEELYRVWQRRKGLPWHIADTKRLSLRETVEEDGAILYEIQKDAQEVRLPGAVKHVLINNLESWKEEGSTVQMCGWQFVVLEME